MCSRLISKLGYRVETAENGEQLVQMILNDGLPIRKRPAGFIIPKELWFKVIILDNEMPVMTGLETVRLLRSYGYGGTIVGVTGYAMEEDVKAFSAGGCNEIFAKPLEYGQFTRYLQENGLGLD